MDITKELTKYAIRAGALLAVLYFAVNMFIAPMAPEWVAIIPISPANIVSAFISMVIAVAIVDYLEKNFLKKYM